MPPFYEHFFDDCLPRAGQARPVFFVNHKTSSSITLYYPHSVYHRIIIQKIKRASLLVFVFGGVKLV